MAIGDPITITADGCRKMKHVIATYGDHDTDSAADRCITSAFAPAPSGNPSNPAIIPAPSRTPSNSAFAPAPSENQAFNPVPSETPSDLTFTQAPSETLPIWNSHQFLQELFPINELSKI